MARPPARAGGRSGLLTEGKSGKSNGYSLHFPKGHLPTSPARPAGGRAVTGLSLRGPQARYSIRSTASPHPIPPEKGVQREEPLPSGVLSPISSQEMGPRPGRPCSLPFQRRRETPTSPPPGRQPLPSISTVPGQTAPDRQTAGFPLGKPAVAFCHGISAQALARNFSSRSSPSLMFSMDTAKDHRT